LPTSRDKFHYSVVTTRKVLYPSYELKGLKNLIEIEENKKSSYFNVTNKEFWERTLFLT